SSRFFGISGMLPKLYVESHQDLFRIRHIADEFSERQRQLFNERRRGDDLTVLGQTRLLIDIDDFEIVAGSQCLFANLLDVHHRPGRTRSRTGDIQAQNILAPRAVDAPAVFLFRADLAPAHWSLRGRMSRPTSTFSVLDRSPMIFLIGSGRFLTSVGIARI